MEPNAILLADPLDILFEHRNKEYGAYPLRKYYNRRLLFSLGVMFAVVGAASVAVILFKPVVKILPFITQDVVLTEFHDKILVEPVKPASVTHKIKRATTAYNALLIVHDPIVPPVAENKELDGKTIAVVTGAGVPDDGPGNPMEHSGNGPATDSASAVSDNKIYDSGVEQMPEFPGGAAALRHFLSSNLRAPETGQESGSQIRVMARFIVNKDGQVTGMEINRSGGGEYDREVLRVIRRMPRWKPGLQRNQPVNVYYMLPVVFTVSD